MLKLNITDKILDKLGFSEYWDEHGTWGTRTLTFSNGDRFQIVEQEEMDDEYEGHYPGGRYISNHYFYAAKGVFATGGDYYDLFFLHEMYEVVKIKFPESFSEFVDKCIGLKMGDYINSWINEKEHGKNT